MANNEAKFICDHMMIFNFQKIVSFDVITYVSYETLSCDHCDFQPIETATATATTLCFASHHLTPVQSFLHQHFCGLRSEMSLRNWDDLK